MKTLVRFGVVGTICFGIQYLIVLVARDLVPIALANLLGFIISAQINFALSYTYTWSHSDRKTGWRLVQKWASFQGIVLGAGAANTTLLWCLHAVLEWNLLVSLIIATAITTTGTFLANHFGLMRPTVHGLEELIKNDSLPASLILERRRDPSTIPGVAMFFPGKNEGANLPRLLVDAATHFEYLGEPFTLIPVDDGSTDNTLEVVKNFKQIYGDRVQLVRHKVNRGYGAALRSGLKAGEKTRHEWVGFCDADRQFDPADISKLINAAENADADIAIGHRIQRADGFKRKLMGRGWHMLSRLILGFDAKDVDCGFKVFRREAVQDILPDLRGEHAVISPEILARAKRAGHKIVEVGIEHFPREEGEQTGAQLHVVLKSIRGLFETRRAIRHDLSTTNHHPLQLH